MMKYTYLLVNFFTILIPFLFSFHPKLKFHKTWKAFFPAVIIVAVFFIIWDYYFTDWGVWGFNEEYVTGLHLLNLPIEEVLFFFCIPYACVFTFHCLSLFIKNDFFKPQENLITIIVIAAALILLIIYFDRMYTVSAMICLILAIITAKLLQVNWLHKFYIIYMILLIPFIIVNGILTGTGLENPVVWYNDDENMSKRFFTIPIDDFFYSMALILWNVLLYHVFLQKFSGKQMYSK